MVYSKYMKDGGKTEMRKAIAVILTIVLSLCIFAGCGPKKTGENVMPEEDFNIYKDGKVHVYFEELAMNTSNSMLIFGGETYRGLKIGDSIELLEALYGNEIVCYEDESGKLQECSVSEYIDIKKEEEYISIILYRVTYEDKIYRKKEISELPADENKFFETAYITFYIDNIAGKINNIFIVHGRDPLGFKLA